MTICEASTKILEAQSKGVRLVMFQGLYPEILVGYGPYGRIGEYEEEKNGILRFVGEWEPGLDDLAAPDWEVKEYE